MEHFKFEIVIFFYFFLQIYKNSYIVAEFYF